MTAPSKPRLVIIGSGWAGFYLAENIDLNAYSVTVISPRRTSAYTPLLASAAVGLFNFYLAEEPVRSKSRCTLRFIKANVLDINFPAKTCRCAPAFDEDPQLANDEFDVEYDYLVIAPGCQPNTFGTPGVAEHAIFIKNVSDAMKVRKTMFDLLEKASLPNVSPTRAKELLHIAIVGGGPTGIELTAELDDLCQDELRYIYPQVAEHVSISIYDVAPHILSAYDSKLHEYATSQLEKRHIDVAPNTRIEKVDSQALYIKDKGRVPYGMLIWATGNKNVPLLETIEVKLSERGLKRILTDDHLRVFKPGKEGGIHDGVFALGDAADIEGASLPTTAEVAVQKAKYLVRNFNELAKSSGAGTVSAFPQPFTYSQKQLVSYIGAHDGVIAGKGPNSEGWTGRSAWLAWRSGSLMWNRNWRSRVTIALTWILNRIWGKEIAKM
ncbi:putative NADH dehydrogenase [Cladophialophora carrionii]|uniref:Putative NADH dehydrogenase n=1 Tax=Cladophialophora carrionii TaxID=86049 RepID=A0A1C1CKJ2_9EURO|nr:putative NADH dehydrogenase [Cladophialophora carrionii]